MKKILVTAVLLMVLCSGFMFAQTRTSLKEENGIITAEYDYKNTSLNTCEEMFEELQKEIASLGVKTNIKSVEELSESKFQQKTMKCISTVDNPYNMVVIFTDNSKSLKIRLEVIGE